MRITLARCFLFNFSKTWQKATLLLLTEIYTCRSGQRHTSIYDKRDNITNIPFLSSNIPSSPAYGVFYITAYTRCPGLLLIWMFYSEGNATLIGIQQWPLELVIEEVLPSIRGSFQTIWSSPLTNVKYHSDAWSYTMASTIDQTLTKQRPYYSTWPFIEWREVSIEHLRRVKHSDREAHSSGRLAPSH